MESPCSLGNFQETKPKPLTAPAFGFGDEVKHEPPKATKDKIAKRPKMRLFEAGSFFRFNEFAI